MQKTENASFYDFMQEIIFVVKLRIPRLPTKQRGISIDRILRFCMFLFYAVLHVPFYKLIEKHTAPI